MLDQLLKKMGLVLNRKYIVNKKLQYHLLIIFVGGSIFNTLIVFLSLKYILFDLTQNLNVILDLPAEDKKSILNVAANIMNNTFYIIAAIFLAVTFYLLSFSNRIAGPIYNMNRQLLNYISGVKSERIRIRKSDYFHDLAENINTILDNTSNKDLDPSLNSKKNEH